MEQHYCLLCDEPLDSSLVCPLCGLDNREWVEDERREPGRRRRDPRRRDTPWEEKDRRRGPL